MTGDAWFREPSVNLGSSTLTRVKDDGEVDSAFQHRPTGFTARLVEAEPLVWEGDNA